MLRHLLRSSSSSSRPGVVRALLVAHLTNHHTHTHTLPHSTRTPQRIHMLRQSTLPKAAPPSPRVPPLLSNGSPITTMLRPPITEATAPTATPMRILVAILIHREDTRPLSQVLQGTRPSTGRLAQLGQGLRQGV